MVRAHAVTRSVYASGVAAALAIMTIVSAQAQAGGAAQVPLALDALLDRAASTPPGTFTITDTAIAPSAEAVPMTVQADVLRGAERRIRVAVAVGAELPQAGAVRIRVVPSGAQRSVGNAASDAAAGRVHVIQEFELAAGEYEVQATVGHGDGGRVVAALSKARVVVPDVWSETLAVTPLVVGDVRTGARAAEARPFVFGKTIVSPATAPTLKQTSALNLAYRIYNWSAESGAKPDLTVEYLFFQQGAKRLSFFNKTKPQRLSAATLDPSFDVSSGAVTGGISVPLASFPLGEFRVVVRVADAKTRRTIQREARFVVIA